MVDALAENELEAWRGRVQPRSSSVGRTARITRETSGRARAPCFSPAWVTRNMGQFYTMANALQVMGEGTKKGSARGCLRNGYRYKSGAEYRADLERTDCHKTDAYAALIQGPPQIGDFSVCNPLDFREPPVDLLWARFVNAKKSIDLKFDANSDRGETGELTLGGSFRVPSSSTSTRPLISARGASRIFSISAPCGSPSETGTRRLKRAMASQTDPLSRYAGGVIYSDKFRDRGRSTTASIQVTRHPGEKVAVHARVKCFNEFINIDWGCFVPTIDCTASESTGDLGGNLTFKWSLERTPITGRGCRRERGRTEIISRKSHIDVTVDQHSEFDIRPSTRLSTRHFTHVYLLRHRQQ